MGARQPAGLWTREGRILELKKEALALGVKQDLELEVAPRPGMTDDSTWGNVV